MSKGRGLSFLLKHHQVSSPCGLSGYGGLGLSIEGPSKVDINCEDVEDGTCRVTYCPTEPGNYIINIKFADQHVPGERRGRSSSEQVVSGERDLTCLLPNRKSVHREGVWRGTDEGEHHQEAPGSLHRYCGQHL